MDQALRIEVCYFCFCDPCLSNPAHLPAFVRGSTAADLSNVARRYRLYRKLWSYLRRLGLWDFAPYKQRKEATGHGRSPRDIIPWCIKQVCCLLIWCQYKAICESDSHYSVDKKYSKGSPTHLSSPMQITSGAQMSEQLLTFCMHTSSAEASIQQKIAFKIKFFIIFMPMVLAVFHVLQME